MSANSPFVDLQCGSCGAQLRIDPGQRTARCPFCDAPSVVDRPPAPGRPMPVFAMGFAVEREAATRAVRDWIRSRRMAPFGLRNLAVERMSGVYLPAYLYSATANSRYEASIAEIYKKVRFERDDDGFSVGRGEEKEYRDLTGRHVASLADILVTASHSVTNEEIQAIEPFDLGRLRRYTSALLQGWSAEEVSASPETCLGHAQGEARASVTRLLHNFMPGDGVRSLRHQTEFEEESIDLTLIPVWICTMRYHPRKPPLRILVNGQTARAGGWVPFSWAKLGLILLASAAIVAGAIVGLRLLGKAFL